MSKSICFILSFHLCIKYVFHFTFYLFPNNHIESEVVTVAFQAIQVFFKKITSWKYESYLLRLAILPTKTYILRVTAIDNVISKIFKFLKYRKKALK